MKTTTFLLLTGLLFRMGAAIGQPTDQKLLKSKAMQVYRREVCDCLITKTTNDGSVEEILKECMQDGLEARLVAIANENDLPLTRETGQRVGLLLVKGLSDDCPGFQKLRAKDPDYQLLQEAESLREKEKWAEAMAIYDRFHRANIVRLDWTIYNNRGLCKLETGDYYGAVADFEYAVQRDTSISTPYANRGLAKQRLGDQQGAYADFTRAISLDSSQATVYENRGLLFYNADQPADARPDFLKAVALQPKSPASLYYLGVMGREAGNLSDTTLRYFNSCIEMEPANGQYYNARGLFYAARKDNKMARADYTKAVQISPDYNPAFYNLARLDGDEKRYDAALTNIDKAIRIDSSQGLYHEERASLLTKLKRYRDALISIEKAIAIDPDKAVYHDTQAEVHEAAGAYQKAIDSYTRSISLYERDGNVYYRRGMAYLKLNNKKKACEDFQTGAAFKSDEATKAIATHCK